MWDWEIASDKIYCSPRWKEIVGFSLDDSENEYKAWESLVHSADLPRVLHAMQDCLDNKSQHYTCEYRIWHKSSRWIWVLARAKVVSRDTRGRALRMVGTIVDISDKKALEDELLRKTSLLRECANQMPGVIFQLLMHANGQLICPYISDKSSEFLGFTPNEIAIDFNIIFSLVIPEDRDTLRASLIASARDMQRWSHQFRVKLPEEESIWLQGNADPVRMDNGDVVWHGFITDLNLAASLYETYASRSSNP